MKRIDYTELSFNPMTLFAKEWFLLTAGNATDGYNAMTVSWGHLGAIWGNGGGKPTAIAYVRPQRYTKEFMDREDLFTLSAFDPSYKKALGYLGSHSGRDGDKIKEAGLTPLFIDGTTAFQEAKLVFVCKKLYHARLQEEGFTDPAIMKESYAGKDFHEAYYGEIVDVFVKD